MNYRTNVPGKAKKAVSLSIIRPFCKKNSPIHTQILHHSH